MPKLDLYNYLIETYGFNEPIISKNVSYKKYSRQWLYKEFNKLCECGKIIKYEKGLYYIPTKTALGYSLLDPKKVIEKKYINNGDDTIGYYSGVTFLNQLGISTQMPNIIELYTNNERANVRDVNVGKQKVLLRRARTDINKENVAVLSLLELMNFVPASFFDEDRRKTINLYIVTNKISRQSITKYAPVFPDRAMRTLVESEVIYGVAQ